MDDEEVSDFLEHFGVRGMQWGVRREKHRQYKAKQEAKAKKKLELTQSDKDILAHYDPDGTRSAEARDKYGPGTLSGKAKSKYKSLTVGQQNALKLGGKVTLGVGLAVGANYALKYADRKIGAKMFIGDPNAPKEFKGFVNQYFKSQRHGFRIKDHMSTEPINLKAGSILKRVSSEKETMIRPEGFFAAYRDSDVTRYKAVLPAFWKQWGINKSDGWITNLRAKVDIKAPSPKGTIDMFGDFENSSFPSAQTLKQLKKSVGPDAAIQQAVRGWTKNNDPLTKEFFAFAKEKGFNALPDLNDARGLSDMPLRTLDGSMFEIAGNTKLSRQGIQAAREAILKVAHFVFDALNSLKGDSIVEDDVDIFLEHFGVRGMQWGVRKDRATGTSKKTSKEARKDAEESARAKMFYGKGAGTRRKLIKNTVESKQKKDPEYAKAYEHHLSKQDMGTHASKARSERSRKDKKEVTSKTAKATIRRITGEPGTQAAFVAGAFAGAAYLNSPGGRVKLNSAYGKLQKGAGKIMQKKGALQINRMIKKMG